MRWITLFGVITLITLSVGQNCPNFFSGIDCKTIECLNGGYVKNGTKICTCPPGYLGIHCEAVKTSRPPDNHYRAGGTSFNVLNVNLHTQFWGVKTYSNVMQGLASHYADYPDGYNSYNLVESTSDSIPHLDSTDLEINDVKFQTNNTKEFTISAASNAGLYWCYQVPIYTQIVKMVQNANLRNTVITIITEHPPSTVDFENARQITVSFGIRVNVLWIVDNTYSRCKPEDVAPFKAFADITGGLFVQLQAEENDAPTQQLVSQVLMTHYKPQYVSIQSFPDCSGAGKTMPVVVDPMVSGPYNFLFLGDNASPTGSSFTSCLLRPPIRSFKNPMTPPEYQLSIFQSPDPMCSSLTITANGSCTAIVFTNAAAENGPLNLVVYTTYVEDHTIDSSRYSIIEKVPFFPAFHVEAPSTAIVTVNSVAASYDNTWNPELEKRSAAAYEWVPSKPITCDASQTYSLYLNISVDTSIYQRAVRVACVPIPVVTTVAPVTPTITTPGASSTVAVDTTVVTSAPTSTDSGSSTTGANTNTCNIGNSPSSFLFAYSNGFEGATWNQVQSTIVQAVSGNQNNYTTLGNVLTDTAAGVEINYTDNSLSFSIAIQQSAPNTKAPLDQLKPSDGLDVIRSLLNRTTGLENSMIVMLVNRLPKSTDDLTDDQYDQLTNMNIKIFPIISIDSLAEEGQIAGRSGSVYNRIAAQTNGHYIVANSTISKQDVNSDFNKIVATLMQSAYSKNLLFSRNLGVNRFGTAIGTVRIPTKASATVQVTITVTLSAVDGNAPQLPTRLFLGFKPNGNDTKTVSIDFLTSGTVTRYSSSNFYTTTVDLETGYDRDLYFQYASGADQSDVLIRMWIDNDAYHHAGYVGLQDINKEIEQVDEYAGAALRVKLFNNCYQNKPARVLITDCNGEVSTKYDVDQTITTAAVIPDSTGFPTFAFVPFFCDSKPANPTCINGADSKYDVQFVTDGYSVSRSFQCRAGVGSKNSDCLLTDANGNYQCSGPSPFKRGPTGNVTDCSNHGHLQFDNTGSYDTYTCICDPGYSGISCESVTCSEPNIDPLAIDNQYHTYTVILGLESTLPAWSILDDAKEFFGLPGVASLDNIWKYQLITYCYDGGVEMVYSGSDLKSFQNSFDYTKLTLRSCAKTENATIDLTKLYQTAVQGLGRNVKGVIAYFSEVSSVLDVTLDEFVQASQPYQQQVFLFPVDEANTIVQVNATLAQAAMSTGGFIFQTGITGDHFLDSGFIPDLLAASSSIAVYSTEQTTDFAFYTEVATTKAYLLTWGAIDIKTTNVDLLRNCKIGAETSLSCLVTGSTSYAVKYSKNKFYVAVYILGDVAPKAQIISDLARDASNAVSTTKSDTRTILSIHVPNGYSIVGNDGDGGVTRNAQRTACTFQWTAYSVFATQKYTAGANVAQITLQKDGEANKYTRFFAFGTSAAPVCQNGGTANESTGSCVCSPGFQGPDCSLVNCLQNSKANAWADVCVCSAIDDVACATQYTPKSFWY